MRAAIPKRPTQVMAWECDVSLIGNPAIVGGMAKIVVIAGVLLFALVGGVIGAQDGIEAVVPLAKMLVLVLAGLFVFLLLITLVFFGNRMRMAFVLDERGVLVEVLDGRAKAASRFAALVGTADGNPGVAGAGLITISDDKRSALWSSIAAVKYDAARHTITLRNRWRTVLHVFCTAENYQAVAAHVAAAVGSAEAPAQKSGNPLWSGLRFTVVVGLAVLPLFSMPRGLEPHMLAVMIALCFALATVWLVPLMAWPMLGGVGWIVASIAAAGGARFEHLGHAEFVKLAMAGIGLAVLVIIAVAALRGKLTSVLARDREEMAGGP